MIRRGLRSPTDSPSMKPTRRHSARNSPASIRRGRKSSAQSAGHCWKLQRAGLFECPGQQHDLTGMIEVVLGDADELRVGGIRLSCKRLIEFLRIEPHNFFAKLLVGLP